MTPVVSMSPARTNGAMASDAAGRVAAGDGDEVGADDLVAEQLGDAVGGLGQQLGRGVLRAVPLRVERGVLEPEVGRRVDDPLHPAPQLGHDRLAEPVRQAEEHQVEPGALVGAGRGERADRGRPRPGPGYRSATAVPGLAVAAGEADLELGMGREETQQLRPGEAGRTEDADGDHGATLANSCMTMQACGCSDRHRATLREPDTPSGIP